MRKGHHEEHLVLIGANTPPRTIRSVDIPLSEQMILKKSVELFGDPEPCYIHRTAIMVHMIGEIIEYLKQHDGGKLPPELSVYIEPEFERIYLADE
jgi:hypothetical protein